VTEIDDHIKKYIQNNKIHNYFLSKFNRLRGKHVENFIILLLRNVTPLTLYHIIGNNDTRYIPSLEALKRKVNDTYINTIRTHNMKHFDKDFVLKPEVYKEVRDKLYSFIEDFEKDIDYDTGEEIEKDVIRGKEHFLITDNISYDKYRKWFCDEKEHNIKYNFKGKKKQKNIKHDLFLQVMEIDIVSEPVEFDYPVEYTYVCTRTENPHITRKKLYETISVNHSIKCEGIIEEEGRNGITRKRCNAVLKPDEAISEQKPCYYYRVIYSNDNEKKIYIDGYSFNKYSPGKYLSAFFIIYKSFDRPNFHIVDVKKMKDNVFNVPEKKDNENYILTLCDSIDEFIAKQTGTRIWGLLPVKIALVLQAAKSYFNTTLNANVQFIGETSSGKTMILKRYGFFFYGGMFKSTFPGSLSIPALRGSNRTMNFFGATIKMPVIGLLGSYRCLHIDEMREDKNMLENMKTFLLENSYSYDKSDSEGAIQKRLAHINVSENINIEYKGMYFNSIKKAYNAHTSHIADTEKVDWDDTWDLYMPLYKYDNPYLFKVIKNKRDQCFAKEEFWIDGYPIPVHNRFPFYFYMVHEKQNNELIDIATMTDETFEKEGDDELLKTLKNNEIIDFLTSLNKYMLSDDDNKIPGKVKSIIKDYGMECDIRQMKFYRSVVKISRILNQRNDIQETDYDILRYLMENTNCKVDVSDTKDFVLKGPVSKDIIKEMEDKVEKETDKFDVRLDEFDENVI